MHIFPLFSGSSGNACYILFDRDAILIDAGVSLKRISERADQLGLDLNRIKAILVTHEHSDHTASVGAIHRKLKIPIYAKSGTWTEMESKTGRIERGCKREIEGSFSVGDIDIVAFDIPHDAKSPCGFTLQRGINKVAVATDMGEMNSAIFANLSGSNEVLLESNHDIKMLENGPYPRFLKDRIRGKLGHLSNTQAAVCAAALVGCGTEKIVLGHLSGENNTGELAFNTVKCELEGNGIKEGKDVMLWVKEYEGKSYYCR